MGAGQEAEQWEDGEGEYESGIPTGYEEEYELAGALLAEGGAVPRYDAAIDSRWRRPELSIAWEYEDYDHIGAEVIIRGERVEGRSRLVGPRFMRATRRSSANLPSGNIRWAVLSGGLHVRIDPRACEETWTVAHDNEMSHDPMTSTMTERGGEVGWRSTRTRGKCRGYSADSHEGLCEKLSKRLPPKELLVGRTIWATLSPNMNRPADHIKWQIAELKKVAKELAEKYGIWILFRLGFAPDSKNWKPHVHLFIVLPLVASRERCRILSWMLKRDFDRAWRDLNGYGIMTGGWRLKEDQDSVEQAIQYAKQHETHEKAWGEWDRPWREFGAPPEIPEYHVEVTADQMQRVWAALCRYKGRAAHPWACNFSFDDVDTKLVLMLLLRVGVPLSQEVIDLYRGVP